MPSLYTYYQQQLAANYYGMHMNNGQFRNIPLGWSLLLGYKSTVETKVVCIYVYSRLLIYILC